jgi:hypothetical protein
MHDSPDSSCGRRSERTVYAAVIELSENPENRRFRAIQAGLFR